VYILCFFIIIFLVILGFELRVSLLLGKGSITSVIPLFLFALAILEIGSCFWSRPASDCSCILQFYFKLPYYHWDNR
jgi:hypothetical protein